MRNIALILTYLGTDYHGWQVQKNLPTVAETLEKAAGSRTAIRTACFFPFTGPAAAGQ